MRLPAIAFLLLASFYLANADQPQLTLPQMPRYDRYAKLQKAHSSAVERGAESIKWADDGKSFTYREGAKNFTYDLATNTIKEGAATTPRAGRNTSGGRRAPARGRQFDAAYTADGKMKAVSRDRNVYLSDSAGKNEVAVTSDGSAALRVKYGIASWVYGEELGVREAMWFSPDGSKLAYYRFDEKEVPDYFIAYKQLDIQDTLDQEAYPKAGAPNPKVELYIYDIATKQSQKVETEFDDAKDAEYVYDVGWSPEGSELLFHRMNRKQNVMEICAADKDTGKCRVVVSERRTDGWVDQSPEMRFLKDKKRFILASDRTGFNNLYLYDISGKLLRTLTHHDYEVGRIDSVDEDSGYVYYPARSADNPYLMQFHRVKLDGTGEQRLTDPTLSHTCSASPTSGTFVDIAESRTEPPVTTLRDGAGTPIKELSRADITKFNAANLKKGENFTFTAADGKTKCYGALSFPSDFDPTKKYPLLVFMYGGPGSGGSVERFQAPDPVTELGFVIATMDPRGTSGRGRKFMCAGYRRLGTVEIDDTAAAVKQLVTSKSYLDGKRVGVQGTSYGGYFAALSILRHPEVYQAACASSPVTDWRNYDSIYTERYMGLPTKDDNEKGYDEGSCMTYVKNLRGRLMLYYGTADNNVHPSNTIQLSSKLTAAGKRYDMMIGADQGHSQMNAFRMWEYLVNYLILDAPSDALAKAWTMRSKRLALARRL